MSAPPFRSVLVSRALLHSLGILRLRSNTQDYHAYLFHLSAFPTHYLALWLAQLQSVAAYQLHWNCKTGGFAISLSVTSIKNHAPEIRGA
jgi:hypothetical protein